MNGAEWRAQDASIRMADQLDASGVLSACRDLFRKVWSTNVARHEPDELGDTAMSLGLQTHQNFISRAERRFSHDDREPEDSHWTFPGLTVTRSGNAFVMGLAGARITVMKVPYEHGRNLRTEQLLKWDGQSRLRAEMAQRNSAALGGYYSRHPSDLPLFDTAVDERGPVSDFVLIFAGERHGAQTAAWLAAPVLGNTPFAGVRQLWWDDEPTLDTSAPAASEVPQRQELPPLTVTLKSTLGRERGQ